jgi:hypothetical protein
MLLFTRHVLHLEIVEIPPEGGEVHTILDIRTKNPAEVMTSRRSLHSVGGGNLGAAGATRWYTLLVWLLQTLLLCHKILDINDIQNRGFEASAGLTPQDRHGCPDGFVCQACS